MTLIFMAPAYLQGTETPEVHLSCLSAEVYLFVSWVLGIAGEKQSAAHCPSLDFVSWCFCCCGWEHQD